MKFTENDWLDIVSKLSFNGGKVSILSFNLNEKLEISSLEVRTDYSETLASYGRLYPNKLKGFDDYKGNRFFIREDDNTISLYIGEDVEVKKESITIKEFKNPKVIPFAKWRNDYFLCHNLKHKNIDDKIFGNTCIGCELSSYGGFISYVKFNIKYNDYETEYDINPIRILVFTYGMCRNNICDGWFSPKHSERKSYFNENFDLVFEDDGDYHIIKSYFKNDKGIQFCP